MKELMPQEIEVWDILPALRRELSKALVKDYSINQKEVARLLRITGPAVSQYLKEKRAKDIVFGKNITKEIRRSAKKIIGNKDVLIAEIQRLCNLNGIKMLVCKIHKGKSAAIPRNCCVCMK